MLDALCLLPSRKAYITTQLEWRMSGGKQLINMLTSSFTQPLGFAIADVNYGGSTGFGRDYRERLKVRNRVLCDAQCAVFVCGVWRQHRLWAWLQGEAQGGRFVCDVDCWAAARHLAVQGFVRHLAAPGLVISIIVIYLWTHQIQTRLVHCTGQVGRR